MRLPSATWIARGVLGLVFAGAVAGAVVAYNGGGGGGGRGPSAAAAPTQTQVPEKATPTETPPPIPLTVGPKPPAPTPIQPAPDLAPTPTPGLLQLANLCDIPGQQADGGRSVPAGNLTLALPPGHQYVITTGVRDPGGPFVRVCIKGLNSVLFLDGTDGHETSRVLNHPDAANVLDAIARGATKAK